MTLGKKASLDPQQKQVANALNSFKQVRTKLLKIVKESESVFKIPLVFKDSELIPADNKEFYIYEQHLLKLLLELDAVSVPENLRDSRKRIVQEIQQHLNRLDGYKAKQLQAPKQGTGARSLLLGVMILGVIWMLFLIFITV